MASLGTFDVIYSWGVLHHTGDMWGALRNMVPLGGEIFLALYNDQRWLSKYWTGAKRIYNKGYTGKVLMTWLHAPYFLTRHFAKFIIKKSTRQRRGMDPWRDIIDWLGGYPFEVARPESVLAFYREQGFTLEKMTTVDGRHGCNEYVFLKRFPGD